MNLKIETINRLQGVKEIPGDKSISHRSLMIGAIANGLTEIENCSTAADPMSTLKCIEQLGISVENKSGKLQINGKGRFGIKKSLSPLDAGNSGTTIRLLSGILVGQSFPSIITGDFSLVKRPMKRIIDPLRLMGANIRGSDKDTAPIIIEPVNKLKAISYELPVPSAQVKSCIIFAGLYAEGTTTVIERIRTRDHTERMLGLDTHESNGFYSVSVSPDHKIEGKKFFVPGDISAAAFLMAAGLLVKKSKIIIKNVGLNPTRKKILDIFISMGGKIEIENEKMIEGEPIADLVVQNSELHSNIELRKADVVDLIDEIPILAVTCMFADGKLTVRDAKELRTKETDRISAIVNNLRLLGCEVEEYEDGFAFESKKNYKPNILPSYGDHRIAMAFGIAGLLIEGVILENADCVDISFPNFWNILLGK